MENNKIKNGSPEEKSKAQIKSGVGELSSGLSDWLKNLVDLRPGLDRSGTILRIRDNREMKGANAWLLMASIMVASLGLDLNSQAVIIGAMLISPLMSPILGIGLAVGIEDRAMLWDSLYHLLISVGIALLTSFLYFYFTPLGTYTEQIDARTAPTLLDVMIAFFGGIAGIVSGSRKDQSNAIPGVAIATALMPPLCVTGYGIAYADWDIMLKSFYLFFINATFVALATYLVVRLLKFPRRTYKDKKEENRTHFYMAIFAVLLILPSVWILKKVYDKVTEKQKIEAYMNEEFNGNYWNWDDNNITSAESDSLRVVLFLSGEVTDDSLKQIRANFKELDCSAQLKVVRTDLPRDEFDEVAFGSSLEKRIMAHFEKDERRIQEREAEIAAMKKNLDSLNNQQLIFDNIAKEAQLLFPDLKEIGYSKMQVNTSDTILRDMPTFLLDWDASKRTATRKSDEQKLNAWLRYRAKLDTLQIINK